MKKILLIIILSLYYPTYASCPLDTDGAACVADLEKIEKINPRLQHPEETKFPDNFMSKEIQNNSVFDNPYQTKKRDFGTQSIDYGYNANCQFGICTDSGMPKTFDSSQQ